MRPFYLSATAKALIPLMTPLLLLGCNSDTDDNETPQPPTTTASVKVYYKANGDIAARDNGSGAYDGASLYVWNNDNCAAYAGDDPNASDWSTGLTPDGIDSQFGAYWELEYADEATQCINFIPRIDQEKPLGDYDARLDLTQVGDDNSVYTQEGVQAVYPELIATSDIPANTARVYFNTPDGDDAFFTLHIWNNETCDNFAGTDTSWPGIAPTGQSETYGLYWDIPVNGTDNCVNMIATNSSNGDYQTADLKFEFDNTTAIGNIGFVFKGTDKVYYQPLAHKPSNQVELSGASAIFADDNVLLINSKDATSVTLYYSPEAMLTFNPQTKQVENADFSIRSTQQTAANWQTEKPQLSSDFIGFDFDFANSTMSLNELLKGQLIAVASDASGTILATEVQTASALDALYADVATTLSYGAIINGDDTTSFRLWAPTAQSVSLIPFDSDKNAMTPIAMNFDSASGSWVVENTALVHGDYYRYQVTVYHPATDKLETYQVTDPYSLSLSMNSELSQVVDLSRAELKPANWDNVSAPHSQDNPAKMVIYEAHIRDFSSRDESTDPAARGKYAAFSQTDSVPVEHLKALSTAGVTHLHLLPAFDIATINEDPDQVANIDAPFSKLCELNSAVQSDSDLGNYCSSADTLAEVFASLKTQDSSSNAIIQRLNGYVRDVDGYNWGYDPYHYTVPEGSYASDADSMTRIREFRQMVMSIKQDIGMNVVMDVVYNHTNEAGVADKSVLDRIVPWYYQRLNEISGVVENSTCCSNTAPEHKMFAKLIDDSIATWTRDYKIDAFRWDLMGHHPLTQIQHTLAAAQAENPSVYFYGEGWNFGEVENDRMFVQATQANLGGTGIGSFSDRLRDAVRGGGPFDEGDTIRQNQGFGNGAYVAVNDLNTQSDSAKASALHSADLVRLGMAGNLKAFPMIDSTDTHITGQELDYNGQPAGYAEDAWEIQNYVSKHDNQTLWDNNQYKIGYEQSIETRVRMQAVSLATSLLGQGVPFIHMGSELLRSKSMQRDSYDSGDWYNYVDFTKQTNNWNVGLPREDKDSANWALIENILTQAGENATPQAADIDAMDHYFQELVALRSSSGLFTLGYGSDIIERVQFHNTGSEQTPGLIVMSIDNSAALYDANIDAERDGVLVVLNASPDALEDFAGFDASDYQLSSIQSAAGSDSIAYNGAQASVSASGFVNVPAWSVAVFEKRHSLNN